MANVLQVLLVNRIVPGTVERGDMSSHEGVVNVLSIKLIGLVPVDEQVVVSTNTGVPPVSQKGSKGDEAFRRIAMRLKDQADLAIEVPKRRNNLWRKIGLKLGLGR